MTLNTIEQAHLIQYLQEQCLTIQGIYLFGSFASGDATANSDIDLALLTPKSLSTQHKWDMTAGLALSLQRDVDLIELRFVNTVLQEEIISAGQRIATFDWLACEQYEDYIYCSAMDFRAFRQPQLAEIKQRGNVYG